MRVISISGQKGGTGKTSLAVNIAEALRLAGSRVVVVDLDPQASARYWRDIAEEQGATETVPVIASTGMGLMPALRALEPAADVIIVDTPPRMGTEARAAMATASLVLTPVSMGGADVWALEQTRATIAEVRGMRTDGGPRVVAVLNRIDPRTAFARGLPAAVRAQGFEVAETVITNRVAWAESMAVGRALATYAPDSAAMEELRALLAEVKP